MDFEFNPIALVLAVVAFIIGMIVSKGFGGGLFWRLIVSLICGVAGFFVASIIANNG